MPLNIGLSRVPSGNWVNGKESKDSAGLSGSPSITWTSLLPCSNVFITASIKGLKLTDNRTPELLLHLVDEIGRICPGGAVLESTHCR